MYTIIQTDENGDIPDNDNDKCYLNHSCLSSMSFGSFEMAWSSDSPLEAEAMKSRVSDKNPTNCIVIEL